MPPKPSPNAIAGSPRRAAASCPSAGQRRNPADEARTLSDDLDQLLRLESLQARSVADHECKVELVEKLAAGFCRLREHYRGPSTRPCRAPLYRSADGRKAAW